METTVQCSAKRLHHWWILNVPCNRVFKLDFEIPRLNANTFSFSSSSCCWNYATDGSSNIMLLLCFDVIHTLIMRLAYTLVDFLNFNCTIIWSLLLLLMFTFLEEFCVKSVTSIVNTKIWFIELHDMQCMYVNLRNYFGIVDNRW